MQKNKKYEIYFRTHANDREYLFTFGKNQKEAEKFANEILEYKPNATWVSIVEVTRKTIKRFKVQ